MQNNSHTHHNYNSNNTMTRTTATTTTTTTNYPNGLKLPLVRGFECHFAPHRALNATCWQGGRAGSSANGVAQFVGRANFSGIPARKDQKRSQGGKQASKQAGKEGCKQASKAANKQTNKHENKETTASQPANQPDISDRVLGQTLRVRSCSSESPLSAQPLSEPQTSIDRPEKCKCIAPVVLPRTWLEAQKSYSSREFTRNASALLP